MAKKTNGRRDGADVDRARERTLRVVDCEDGQVSAYYVARVRLRHWTCPSQDDPSAWSTGR
ncbi:hypothetical protein [Streptomyces griseofuscus]|uniref:hypothetical protein n=1 Tax=Streptomyces griseofuscus TaxID=146922 RepID=UPI001A9ACBEB|nr:hypothetical protein [Streptomyces griseofuscus]